jgi:5-methylthioadenosine/S-adenosylhomocysteine deaminase
MPGLINAHGHSAMSLFRGLADDFALMDWLENYIWPAEGQFVGEDFVHDGTELAIAEMIKSGTTCFSDMYFFPEITATVCEKLHMRVQCAFPIFDMPCNWGQGPDDYIEKGTALAQKYQDHPLVSVAFGAHAPYTNSDETLLKVKSASEALDLAVQIHLHETAFEVESSEQEHGLRPIARLEKLGLLNNKLQCVHMTTLNDDDIALIQQYQSQVIHCPESNLKLASGFSPIEKLRQAGTNVALGTDGAASNNDLDLFSEMRTAAMLAKAVAQDPTAINAEQAIRMATINGAKALGLENICGSLEKGKAADIIAIDFSQLEQTPVYDVCSHLVYTNMAQRVSHAFIAGKCVMNNFALSDIDEQHLKQRAQQWQAKIAASQSH